MEERMKRQYRKFKPERENQRMKSVIAEITAENIDLKKTVGIGSR